MTENYEKNNKNKLIIIIESKDFLNLDWFLKILSSIKKIIFIKKSSNSLKTNNKTN